MRLGPVEDWTGAEGEHSGAGVLLEWWCSKGQVRQGRSILQVQEGPKQWPHTLLPGHQLPLWYVSSGPALPDEAPGSVRACEAFWNPHPHFCAPVLVYSLSFPNPTSRWAFVPGVPRECTNRHCLGWAGVGCPRPTIWVLVLALPLSCCGSSMPQFPHLWIRNGNGICLTGRWNCVLPVALIIIIFTFFISVHLLGPNHALESEPPPLAQRELVSFILDSLA